MHFSERKPSLLSYHVRESPALWEQEKSATFALLHRVLLDSLGCSLYSAVICPTMLPVCHSMQLVNAHRFIIFVFKLKFSSLNGN